jgi:hypothetical protein
MKILLLASLLFLAACAVEPRDGGVVRMFGYEYGEYVPAVVTLENEWLRLDFITETAEIIVTDRRTGNEFRSTPTGIHTDPATVPIERFYAQSLFLLHHENQAGTGNVYDSYRNSVRNGTFRHSLENDVLSLYFTVGNIPQVFHVPLAIYAERFEYFYGQMERSARMQTLNAFRRLNYDTLRAGERSEMLENFPALADGAIIYVLNDNIPEHMMRQIEGYLEDVGYDRDEWNYDMMYHGLADGTDRAAFNVIMRFHLERNQMIVTIPMYEITYNVVRLPVRLVVMPYFGAGHVTDSGYLFVPDGSGALIHFDNGRYNQGVYANNVFGHDEAIIRQALIHDNRAAFPVFGVTRNDASFVAIIDEGASYAQIRGYVSGMNSSYSRVHASFRLLHGEELDIAGRGSGTLIMHERNLPRENIVIRYVFTEEPGYVAMAHAYRDFLQERYPQLRNRVTQPVTAMVEILGAALTNQHLLGFPVERPAPLTTFAEAEDMLDIMAAFGWRDLHVMMRGVHNDSIDHTVPNGFNPIRQLGGRRGLDSLLSAAERHGYEFYVEGEFVFMRRDAWFDGFRPMRDGARQANRERVEHYGFSHVYFGELGSASALADHTTLARPEFTQQLVRNFVGEAADRGVEGIAFRSMASALAGDFSERNHVSREASMNMRTDLLNELSLGGTNIWLNYGFSYGMPFADIITNMPLTDQGFGITCISVPFYQIALHGLVHFAGRPLNLAEDHSHHLLKSIEAGASLFFSFKDIPTADLEVTRYLRYFANEWDRWQHVANNLYQNHRTNFGHLYNQFITGHEILCMTGITVTIYEDGTRVYVNTTLGDFTADTGVTIPARRYVVRR